MHLTLNYRPATGLTVSEDLFGGNHLFKWNPVGFGSSYNQAVDQLNISGLRYPGGSMTEDWGNAFYEDPNRAPVLDASATTFVGLDTFMGWALAKGQAVTIVLPTSGLLIGEGDGNSVRNINWRAIEKAGDFIRDLIDTYGPEAVAAFELGNEYWGSVTNMTSEEYGKVANALAKLVQQVLDEELGANSDQPDILVQMGDKWGADFDPGGKFSTLDLDLEAAWNLANSEILKGLSAEAMKAIDGLIEHYYYVETTDNLTLGDGMLWHADRYFREIYYDTAQFEAAWVEAGITKDLSLAITEWGPDHWNSSQWGLKGASVLLEMFEGLLRLGADSANAWPVELNSAVDLAGAHDGRDGANSDQLSALGQAFRLMSTYTQGLELVENGLSMEDTAIESVEVNSFGSEERFVFFISSRLAETQEVTLDVSAYVDGFASLSGHRIMQIDPQAHYNQARWWAGTEELSASDLGNSNVLDVSLGAYEVVMVEFITQDAALAANEGEVITGRMRADRLVGSDGEDVIRGLGGNDRLKAADGDDAVRGGTGRDRLIGGDGDDVLFGGAGRDVLHAGAGHDVVTGGGGGDRFVFTGKGFNRITDYQDGIDKIVINSSATSLDDLEISRREYFWDGEAHDGLLLDYGAGAVFVEDMFMWQLSVDDVVL